MFCVQLVSAKKSVYTGLNTETVNTDFNHKNLLPFSILFKSKPNVLD